MRNEIFHDADRLSLPVPDDTTSGAPVKVGSLIGVTATPEGQGGNADGHATVWRKGAFKLDVATAISAVGTPVYITSTNTLTGTGTDNTLFGYALETKGTGTAPITVAIAKV